MMVIPVLAHNGKKGEIFKLIPEKKSGNGRLYLDSNLCLNADAYKAMRTAFALVRPKTDILIKNINKKCKPICGGSLGLPIYLGMYALTNGLKINSKAFVTGSLDAKGKIGRIGSLAEKIKSALGKGEVILVPRGQGIPVKGIRVLEVNTAKEAVKVLFNMRKNGARKR
jgi:hypothetical protein